MSEIYNARGLSDATGATMRQVDYWTNRGVLRPLTVKGHENTGSGNQRLYDEGEVRVARAILALSDLNSLTEHIRRALDGGVTAGGVIVMTPKDD